MGRTKLERIHDYAVIRMGTKSCIIIDKYELGAGVNLSVRDIAQLLRYASFTDLTFRQIYQSPKSRSIKAWEFCRK